MQAIEQRISKRTEFRKPVEFELSATRMMQRDDSLMRRGVGIDISSDGVGLETATMLEKGEVIKLLVPMNGFGANMPVFAEVQWVALGECCRAGLRFLA